MRICHSHCCWHYFILYTIMKFCKELALLFHEKLDSWSADYLFSKASLRSSALVFHFCNCWFLTFCVYCLGIWIPRKNEATYDDWKIVFTAECQLWVSSNSIQLLFFEQEILFQFWFIRTCSFLVIEAGSPWKANVQNDGSRNWILLAIVDGILYT